MERSWWEATVNLRRVQLLAGRCGLRFKGNPIVTGEQARVTLEGEVEDFKKFDAAWAEVEGATA